MFLFVSKGLAGLAHYCAESVRAVYEMPQRILADGTVAYPVDEEALLVQLLEARNLGAKEIQLCLWHTDANPEHGVQVKRCASALGLSVKELDLGAALRQVEHALPVCLERFHRLETAEDYQWRALATVKAKDLVSDLSALGRTYLMRADGRVTEVLSLPSLELDAGDWLGLELHRK